MKRLSATAATRLSCVTFFVLASIILTGLALSGIPLMSNEPGSILAGREIIETDGGFTSALYTGLIVSGFLAWRMYHSIVRLPNPPGEEYLFDVESEPVSPQRKLKWGLFVIGLILNEILLHWLNRYSDLRGWHRLLLLWGGPVLILFSFYKYYDFRTARMKKSTQSQKA